MADFDNGLPPYNTDVSDTKVSDVLIDADRDVVDNIKQISAVGMVTQLADDMLPQTISAVLIQKKEAGINRSMFL